MVVVVMVVVGWSSSRGHGGGDGGSCGGSCGGGGHCRCDGCGGDQVVVVMVIMWSW